MDPGEVTFPAFPACDLLRLGSSLPRIVCLARDQSGATCMSFTSWSIWLLANGAAAAHTVANLGDDVPPLINGANAACCVTVIALTVWKRAAFRRARLPRPVRASCRPRPRWSLQRAAA